MAVTIHDIARELNLSAMTVSRVLSHTNTASVKVTTRIRVEEAAKRLGYRANRNARALASGRTNIIGLWISHLNSSVYSQIAQACRHQILGAGMEISISEMDWHFHANDGQRRFQWPVDGVIAVDPPSLEDLGNLLAPTPWQDIPRVHLGSGQGVHWDGDSVFIDMVDGTIAAVQHLLKIGSKRVAYVVPRGYDRQGMSNYDAYASTLETAGLSVECIVCENWNWPVIRCAVKEHIRQHGHPDGIYCHNDEFAIATFRALRDLSLRVPQDVAIIGSEGNAFLEYFDPPLSTVAMPIADMCQRAFQLLQARIDEPESAVQQLNLPYEFLARESSNP